ncbi:MAG: hypothetical protein M1814_004871 [Vezdaea aestivalis]|nr:MAG: hypothetical protein M1814_004871 [Vezdaea aestivalis]
MADPPPKHKLPVQQLVVLSILRLAEPVALTSVFPYLPEMMEFLSVPPSEIAFYAGLTSAIFSLSQCLTGVSWGRAADRYGRRPTILLAVTCAMVSSLLFGLSRSLTWALVARALGGLSNGNVGMVRTTVAELVPYKDLQPRAFSVMPMIWSVGSVLGPSLGGALAKPAEKFPGTFGGVWFWEEYPFFLPSLVASGLFIVGISTGFLFLQETLEEKKHQRHYGLILGRQLIALFKRPSSPFSKTRQVKATSEAQPLLKDSLSQTGSIPTLASPPQKPPSWLEVFNRQSSLNLVAYTLLALHNIAADQLLSVFLHYPVETPASPFKFTSGFGFSSGRIGAIFAVYGLVGMLAQFFGYPAAARYFGVLRVYQVSSFVAPFIYIFLPFSAIANSTGTRVAALVPVLLLKILSTVNAYPSSMILLTNSAGSRRVLGTLNGVAVSLSALGRAIGPVLAGWMDGWGRRRGYAIAPWLLLAVLAAIGAVPTLWLEEGNGLVDDEVMEENGNERDESEGNDEEAVVDGPPLAKMWSGRSNNTSERALRITGRERRTSSQHLGSHE